MCSCMTKLEFLPKPYMLFRLKKLPLIYMLLVLHWVLSRFVDPYERFVMLLKSRSCTHHPHMHYSNTMGRHNNMPFHLDPPKNVSLLHWEWTPKTFLIGYPPNKCSKFLLLSLKSFVVEKKHWAMQKLFIKKEKKRVEKKMDKCLRYLKHWVFICPPKKRRERWIR